MNYVKVIYLSASHWQQAEKRRHVITTQIENKNSRIAAKICKIKLKGSGQHKNEKEKLKKKYVRRLRLILNTLLWNYKLASRRSRKNGYRNKKNANNPWTASPKSRH
jgi:hypothetical protein